MAARKNKASHKCPAERIGYVAGGRHKAGQRDSRSGAMMVMMAMAG